MVLHVIGWPFMSSVVAGIGPLYVFLLLFWLSNGAVVCSACCFIAFGVALSSFLNRIPGIVWIRLEICAYKSASSFIAVAAV